ncbi:MAG: hypothetical protein HY896_11645 [Deltaproteobacteria bacterium]|nr:hypothetical protein [Deltaproteobacteria bacterium]
MDAEDFDVYPIVHEGKVYNIITPFDMTFPEVHAMLSWLDGEGAFAITPGDDEMGTEKLFSCTVLGVTFEVDVQGYEVIVFRRSV